MIKLINDVIQAELLDGSRILDNSIINSYDYIMYKNRIKYIIGLIKNNALYHIENKDELDIIITEELELTTKTRCKNGDNLYSFISYNQSLHKGNISLCRGLVTRFIKAWNELSEIEKYIIKNSEFITPKISDEEMTDLFMTYKNKYIQYKKSAYIKLGLILKIDLDKEDAFELKNSYDIKFVS